MKRIAPLLLTVVPALAWAVVKPVRVLMPEWIGVTCVSSTVCVDDLSKAADVEALYAEAVAFVDRKVAPISGEPRIVFCASEACAANFGLGARSALTFGTAGTVIGPRAWKAYYVRHELIHYVQARQLGVVPLLAKPSWFVEGMAYGLSEDPREPLTQPFEGHRQAFRVVQDRRQGQALDRGRPLVTRQATHAILRPACRPPSCPPPAAS